MSKTLTSVAEEYRAKQSLWVEIANDPVALTDRGKTKNEAFIIASYYEGKFDGIIEAANILSQQIETNRTTK